MRGLALVCVLACACNDPGLLLEVHASDGAAIASVEVMIPDDVHGGGMGMPPKQSAKTAGKVYEVIDTTAADVSDGTAKVLLQAGSIDAVPALLVVGKDASGAINGYALITDPSSSDGLIHVRHTASDESAPYVAVTQKIACQFAVARMKPPSVGARIGATPITSISRDISRAASWPVARSRTIARGMTMLADPPSAATKRQTASQPRSGASAQPTEAAV